MLAHYIIAPTDTVYVVKPGDGGATELVSMRWGLVLLVEQAVETLTGIVKSCTRNAFLVRPGPLAQTVPSAEAAARAIPESFLLRADEVIE